MRSTKIFLSLLFCLMATALIAGPECALFKNKKFQNAKASIKGTQRGSAIEGVVYFQETADGLRIHAELSGLTPGKHGFHIHEFGATGNAGKDAGGHYNPKNLPHGDVVKQGVAAVHAGDLGNIEIKANGSGSADRLVKGLWLTGHPLSIAGRAVVIHELADDFGQPVGNAGSRMAVGSIILVDEL